MERRTVYCPKCGRKTGVWDGKSTINPIGKCSKCGRIVEYDILSGEAMFKDVPSRTCASGMRFY